MPVGSDHDFRNIGDGSVKVVVIWDKPAETDWSGSGTAKAARTARRND